MFDIGWSELLLIGGVALVVIGPKDLPRALRTLGQTTTKVKRMAADFQRQFNEAVREADMEEFRKGVSDVVETARDLKNNFNPIDKLRSEIKGAIDDSDPRKPLPTTEVASAGDYLTSLPEPAPADPVTGLASAGQPAGAKTAADGKPSADVKPAATQNAASTERPAADADLAAPAPKKRTRKPKVMTGDVAKEVAEETANAFADADAALAMETAPAPRPTRSRKKAVAVLTADDAAMVAADVAGANGEPPAPKVTRRRRKVTYDVAGAPETAATATPKKAAAPKPAGQSAGKTAQEPAKKRAPRRKPAPPVDTLPAEPVVAKTEVAASPVMSPATASVDDAISPAIKPASDGTS